MKIIVCCVRKDINRYNKQMYFETNEEIKI